MHYHALPRRDRVLHVDVGREEAGEAVRHNLGKLDENVAIVAHDRWIATDLKAGRDRDLIGPARDDLAGAQKRNERRRARAPVTRQREPDAAMRPAARPGTIGQKQLRASVIG